MEKSTKQKTTSEAFKKEISQAEQEPQNYITLEDVIIK